MLFFYILALYLPIFKPYIVAQSSTKYYITSIDPPTLAVQSSNFGNLIPNAPNAIWIWQKNCAV